MWSQAGSVHTVTSSATCPSSLCDITVVQPDHRQAEPGQPAGPLALVLALINGPRV